MEHEVGIVEQRARRLADPDTAVLVGGLTISVLLSIWLTWGIWAPGMAAGDDTAAHVVRADYALQHFFTAGSLDGWQSSFGLGYQQFLFIGPGFTILVSLIQLLSFGALSPLDATKVATVISFALVPLALAFLAWAFGLGRRAAGIAAVLGVAVSSVYGGAGLNAIFGSGLLPNHLGSALLLMAFGGLVLVARRPSVRRIVFTAAASAALVATHPIAAIILTFLAAALVGALGTEWLTRHAGAIGNRLRPWLDRVAPEPGRTADVSAADVGAADVGARDVGAIDVGAATRSAPSGSNVARANGEGALERTPSMRSLLGEPVGRLAAMAAAGVLSIGMAGFVLVPLLAHGDLRGENSAWPDVAIGTRLVEIWRGEFLYRPWVALIVVVGFAFVLLLALGRRRGALTLVLTPVFYLVLARAFVSVTPDNIVAIQLTNRSIANIGLIALLPVAALLATPRRFATRVALATGSHPRPGNPLLLVANAAIPLGLALAVVLLPSGLDRHRATTVSPTAPLDAMATELAARVPVGARFATQRLPAQERALTGMSHPDLWLAWATGANTLNIYNLESSVVFEPVYEAEHLNDRPPQEVAERLARLGVSHLAVIDAGDIPGVMESPWFRAVWRDGSMAILEVQPKTGQPAPGDLVSADDPIGATLTDGDPQHLVIATSATVPTTATIAVGWSPKWRVAVNGTPVTASPTADKLMQVPVPAGPATITLDYAIDGADIVGRALTVLSLAIAIAALVIDGRRRREASIDPV
jgi:hypothetical protein